MVNIDYHDGLFFYKLRLFAFTAKLALFWVNERELQAAILIVVCIGAGG
jgi:hypothetical protein